MYPRVKVRAQEEPPTTIRKEDASYIAREVESLSLESPSSRILVPTLGNKGENLYHRPQSKSNPKVLLTPPIAASKGKKNNISYGDNKIKNNGLSKDKKCQNDSNLPHLRVSESNDKNLLRPATASSNGANNDALDEDNRTNIRASSIPMPRAVLSSPDNDGLIGSQNQQIREKQSLLRRQTLKSNSIASQQNQLIKEKRTLTQPLSSSPKTETQTKLSLSKLESPLSTGKVVKESGNSSIVKGRRSSVSAPMQRPPFIN